jgi:hypothetical protein
MMPKINDQRLTAIISDLAEKTKKNYPEALKMMNDPEYARQRCRDYSAKKIRKERILAQTLGYRMRKISESNYIFVKRP